jgi:DNA-binding MarR family transcriptional regulator
MDIKERRRVRVGYAIKRAHHAERIAIDHALRDLGLTTAQWAALIRLDYHEGLSNADLARLNDCTPQTMIAVIMNLEAAGLVERYRHPTNGTLLPTRLTELGRELLDRCTERVEAVEERMLSDLDEDERGRLIALLDRCTDALHREPADVSAV